MNGGRLTAVNEFIGYDGTGIFNQNGGYNRVSNDLNLGYYAGSSGTYNQNDGYLRVVNNLNINGARAPSTSSAASSRLTPST